MEAYLSDQTAVVITNYSLTILFCTPLFRKLCGSDQSEILNRNLFDLLSDFSLAFKDNVFRKDLLAPSNSFTTVEIAWPSWQGKTIDNYPKTIICHDSFGDCSGVDKRIFTFSINVPISTPQSSEQKSDIARIPEMQHTSNSTERSTSYLLESNIQLRKEIRQLQLELEALRESELRFRNLTEANSDFFWEIDAQGLYSYASPKCLDLLGINPEELLGSLYLLLRDPITADKFFSEIQAANLKIRNFRNWNYTVKHQNGQEVIMQSSGEPVFKKVRGKQVFAGFRGIDRDITQRVLYEKRLRLAKQAAERANNAKSDFLANMSHELRTPLHAILSYSRYGEKKYKDSPRKELGHYFNQISKSAHRLFPFIDGLLDLSKLEAGKMQYTFCYDDVREEFLQVLVELTPLASEKEIEIILHEPSFRPIASFDRQRLGQVIRNILANAIKFSTPGSAVEISFEPYQDRNNSTYLRTTITNVGVGIPQTELETIFDKFFQSSTTRTSAGGTGLGLSICREIINNMHGSIWAESENGLTSFHFTLPTSKRAEKLGQILVREGLISKEELVKALKLQQNMK